MGEGTGMAPGWLRECPGPGTEGVYVGCGLHICPSCCHACPSSAGPVLVLAHESVPVHVPVPVPLLIIVWGPHAGIVQIHTHMHASVCLPASLSACLSWFCVCVCVGVFHRVPVCASVCVCVQTFCLSVCLSVCLGFRFSVDCCNWSLSVL